MSKRRLISGVSVIGVLVTGALIISGCGPSDTKLSAQVKEKLAADNTVKVAQIDVDTKDRVVTLSGTVDTQAVKERAVTLARDTNRVTDVVDHLVVKEQASTAGAWPPGPAMGHEGVERGMMSDSGIMAAVRDRLMADSTLARLNIAVDARDGTVSLSGRVSREAERTHAVELARQTRGVRRVVDKLEIGR